jgi:hypothetical protein
MGRLPIIIFLFLAASGATSCGDQSGDNGEQTCEPQVRMACWPAPGPGAQIRWLDSCGEPGDVVDACLGTHVECVETSGDQVSCECLNHWEGEECTRCPGNWDPDQDCAVCRNHWFDAGDDCGTCPGNWDPDQDCDVCRNRWLDVSDDCGTCPQHFNPLLDCSVCMPGWTGENCDQVAMICDGTTCIDPASGLMWQQNSGDKTFDYTRAGLHCAELDLGGYSDWRLPDIGEMRSLVRGCGPVEADGPCRVSAQCLDLTCHDESCTPVDVCLHWGGPGPGGCYWPPELAGECDTSHWTSSIRLDDDRRVWDLQYRNAYLSWSTRDHSQYVRCVRGN